MPNKPDAWVQLAIRPTNEENHVLLKDVCAELREQGMQEIRMTAFEEHGVYVVEGWRERPTDPAPCVPALTFAAAGSPAHPKEEKE